MENRVRRIVADVLDLDAEEIDGSVGRDTIDVWDSLKHISLCVALEEEFNVTLPNDAAVGIVTVADAVRYIEKLRSASPA